MPAVKIFFIILFAIIIAVFAVKNMNSVEISYYDFHLDSHVLKIPLLVLVICSVCIGFAVAWVGGFFERLKLQSRIRKISKSNQALTQDLDQLKSAADKDLGDGAD